MKRRSVAAPLSLSRQRTQKEALPCFLYAQVAMHMHTQPLQPGRLTPPAILGRKALGLRSRIASTAACRVVSCSQLLWQLMQLQPSQ